MIIKIIKEDEETQKDEEKFREMIDLLKIDWLSRKNKVNSNYYDYKGGTIKMTEQEYKENLTRMFDSVRDNNKGARNCGGVNCHDCPLFNKVCNGDAAPIFYIHEAADVVEEWAKQHPIETNTDKLRDEDKENTKKIGLTDAEFRSIIIDYLLGEDWYVADPVPHVEANEIALHQILERYSKKYRKQKRLYAKLDQKWLNKLL